VTRAGDGPVAAGAEWDGRYKGMDTMHVRLDEYERPKRLKFTTTGNKLDMQWTFVYSSQTPSKTHVDAHAVIEPKGAMKLMGPLIGRMIRRTFSKRPAQLEAGLKAPAVPSAPAPSRSSAAGPRAVAFAPRCRPRRSRGCARGRRRAAAAAK
jgi:hypothetical protein